MTASQLSPEYYRYMRSTAWMAKRRAYFASPRTPKRCQGCGARERLDLHHRTYVRFTHELLSDLVPVCRQCHQRIHQGFDSRKGDLPKRTEIVLAQLRRENNLPTVGSDGRRKPQAQGKQLTAKRARLGEDGIQRVPCPTCLVQIGSPCVDPGKQRRKAAPRQKSHQARVKASARTGGWEAKNPRPKPKGKDPVNDALNAMHPAVAAALERRRRAERTRNGL